MKERKRTNNGVATGLKVADRKRWKTEIDKIEGRKNTVSLCRESRSSPKIRDAYSNKNAAGCSDILARA